MKRHTLPIETDMFYHIYNRGINGTDIFPEERNYAYFLQKYIKYIEPVADTHAYCLLRNHFHLLVHIKPAAQILTNLPELVRHSAPDIVSLQFSHLFNGYSQAINKAMKRSGNLFEAPFRRIPVMTEAYFRELVYYIHNNPQRHGFVSDYRDYKHSSYQAFISAKETKLKRAETEILFGGSNNFTEIHRSDKLFGSVAFERDMVIEFD